MAAVEGRGAGPPRGRPETFHRSRGAKLTVQAADQAPRLVVARVEPCASDSVRGQAISATRMRRDFAKSTVNFDKLEVQLSKVTCQLLKVGNLTCQSYPPSSTSRRSLFRRKCKASAHAIAGATDASRLVKVRHSTIVTCESWNPQLSKVDLLRNPTFESYCPQLSQVNICSVATF